MTPAEPSTGSTKLSSSVPRVLGSRGSEVSLVSEPSVCGSSYYEIREVLFQSLMISTNSLPEAGGDRGGIRAGLKNYDTWIFLSSDGDGLAKL